MPAITATELKGLGTIAVTETTLDGSDSLVYDASKEQVLILRNPTSGAISPVIDGNASSNAFGVDGVGSLDLTGGYQVGSIAAGAVKAIRLSTIRHYLEGTIAINSGTGLVAVLLNR